MKRNKMSLANITERLSRTEMKKILAGDAPAGGCMYIPGPFPNQFYCYGGCTFSDGTEGTCLTNSSFNKCYCGGAS